MKNKNKKTVVCLIGPTAVGKTEVALKLAKRIRAEIVCCDSMQVYKGIDIATAKPTKRQLREIPHHLVDILRPSQEYNAWRFRTAAQKAIRDIHQRGKTPLIVAGTGLYLRALLDGLFPGPAQQKMLRKRFLQQAEQQGAASLYAKLRDIDPQAAKGIHPNDLRRIIRALEIYELTATSVSEWKEKTCGIRNKYVLRIFGLNRPREVLYQRIEERVDRMFRQRLVSEIKKIAGGRLSRTARSLLGYKEICGFLNGNYSCEEARRLLKRNSRRYAKRQLSWFRHEKAIEWIELGPKDTPTLIVKRICSFLV